MDDRPNDPTNQPDPTAPERGADRDDRHDEPDADAPVADAPVNEAERRYGGDESPG